MEALSVLLTLGVDNPSVNDSLMLTEKHCWKTNSRIAVIWDIVTLMWRKYDEGENHSPL